MKNKTNVIRWVIGIFFALYIFGIGVHYSSLIILLSSLIMLPIPAFMNILSKFKIKNYVAVILSVILFSLGVFASSKLEAPIYLKIDVSLVSMGSSSALSNEESNISSDPSSNITNTSSAVSSLETSSENDTLSSQNTTSSQNSEPSSKPNKSSSNPNESSSKLDESSSKTSEITSVPSSSEPYTENSSVSSIPSSSSKPEASSSDNTDTFIYDYSSSKPTYTQNNVETVYRTPTGKKYHLSSTCGGKNSAETTLNEALDAGLTPCKKCAQ